jgi:cytochrome c2
MIERMQARVLSIKHILTVCLFFVAALAAAQPSADSGKTLFKNYCAQCHAKNMKTNLTGPALGGVRERWDNEEDLYRWIRYSQAMVAEGHPRALELWDQWKPTVMTNFPDLTDDDIASLLLYIDGMYEGTYGVQAGVAVAAEQVSGVKKEPNKWLYIGLAALLGFLALLLSRIVNNLDKLAAAKEGRLVEDRTLLQTLTSKGMILFAVFALVILGGYTTVNRATNLGRQQGYQPDQPIHFSHATHAGLHKIECQYCHDGARRSKHSVIPATNTCMNCHTAIRYGSEYGTAELSKIYASIGYNPADGKYFENYDEMATDSIEMIFKTWMGEQLVANDDDVEFLGAEENRMVDKQWEGLVRSLTNEQKTDFRGPIEWVRIHNLPDHVYFNHAQHVSVGKVECQTCHGNVEEMDVVQQMSPLSMGWCINCHRQTEVDFDGNAYYTSYVNYQEEIDQKEREKVTVADIGGLECQKCHY